MKLDTRIVPFLLLLAGCASLTLPEKSSNELPSAELFQGANVILIQPGQSGDEIRERMVQTLRLQDYEITQRTLDAETIATEPRTFGSEAPGSARFFVQIPDEDGEPIRLYGEYIAQQTTDNQSFQQFRSSRVMPMGQRRSTAWLAWREMDELASAYGAETVLYDRQ